MKLVIWVMCIFLMVVRAQSAFASHQPVHLTLPLAANTTHVSIHVYLVDAYGQDLAGDQVIVDVMNVHFNGRTLTDNILSNGDFESGNINRLPARQGRGILSRLALQTSLMHQGLATTVRIMP